MKKKKKKKKKMENHRLVSDNIRTEWPHFMLILLPKFTVSRMYVCTERVNIGSIFLFHTDISYKKITSIKMWSIVFTSLRRDKVAHVPLIHHSKELEQKTDTIYMFFTDACKLLTAAVVKVQPCRSLSNCLSTPCSPRPCPPHLSWPHAHTHSHDSFPSP